MVNASNTPTSYTKAPQNTMSSGTNGQPNSSPKPTKEPKKIFGVELRSLGAVLGLTLFLVLAMAGVFIALRQRMSNENVAPTAPESRPSAAEDQVNSCTLSFTVSAPNPNQEASCTKTSFANDPQNEVTSEGVTYMFNNETSTFSPGDVVVYYVLINNTGDEATDVTITDVIDTNYLTFLDSNCGANAYNSSTNTLTCNLSDVPPVEQTESQGFIAYRAQVDAATTEEITIDNTATITYGENESNTCSHTIIVTPTTEEELAQCNESCNTNADCAEADHICTTDGVCRLEENPGDVNCEPAEDEPELAQCNEACNVNSDCAEADHICTTDGVCRLEENPGDENCQLAQEETEEEETTTTTTTTTTRTSQDNTPLAQCNESCQENADCLYTSHICYEGQCRLDTNVTSTTCSAAAGQQPTLPEELPKTGADDVLNWLKAGLGVLGIGAALLLLL